MKRIIFIFLLILPTQSYAYQSKDGTVSAFGDLLIWRVREGGADHWAQNIVAAGTLETATIFDAPFDWNAGFRVGVAYNSYNCWNATLYWTRYETKAADHAAGNIFSPFLGNFFANNTDGANFGPFYRNADIEWEFKFNTIDLELGRAFEINPILDLRPFIGLKGAFINQDINTNWHGPSIARFGFVIPVTTFSSATENLEHDFAGVGPSVGLDTTWNFYEDSQTSLSLVGNISGAILWGRWHFQDVYQNNTPLSIAVNLSNINGAAPMIRGLLGVEWDTHLFNTNVIIRLSYEAQIWFNQMQFYELDTGRLNNLMSLQGGTLDICIHF